MPAHVLLCASLCIAGVMSVPNEGVEVYVRTRPTAQFAQELIEYLPDKQVCKHKKRKSTFIIGTLHCFP